MKSLVTCIATAGSTHERCRLQKREGSDYCNVHQDAIHVKDVYMDESQEEKKSDDQPCEESGSPFMSLSKLVERIRQSCRNILPYQENARNWTLFSIEDAFLCERNEPYPLGLIVRRLVYLVNYINIEMANLTQFTLIFKVFSRLRFS